MPLWLPTSPFQFYQSPASSTQTFPPNSAHRERTVPIAYLLSHLSPSHSYLLLPGRPVRWCTVDGCAYSGHWWPAGPGWGLGVGSAWGRIRSWSGYRGWAAGPTRVSSRAAKSRSPVAVHRGLGFRHADGPWRGRADCIVSVWRKHYFKGGRGRRGGVGDIKDGLQLPLRVWCENEIVTGAKSKHHYKYNKEGREGWWGYVNEGSAAIITESWSYNHKVNKLRCGIKLTVRATSRRRMGRRRTEKAMCVGYSNSPYPSSTSGLATLTNKYRLWLLLPKIIPSSLSYRSIHPGHRVPR